jgi:hypothetical protein
MGFPQEVKTEREIERATEQENLLAQDDQL